MAVRVHVDHIFRRGGVNGHKFATGPDRFARVRIVGRARGRFLDLLAL